MRRLSRPKFPESARTSRHYSVSFPAKLFLAFCLALLSTQGNSQITGALLDKETGAPIAFATLRLGDTQSGIISNIDGTFILPAHPNQDSLIISCLGYISIKVSIASLNEEPFIKLTRRTIALQQVDVYPGENPALTLMQRVVEAAPRNNPQESTNYTCMVYHKMVFRLDTDHPLTERSDSLSQKLNKFSNERDLMLVESVSEKRHMAPDKDYERIVSGRVSGFQNTGLSILPSQIQPFTFYSQKISLLNESYLNPVSAAALEKYMFLLQDTIIDRRDTVYHLTFTPRKDSKINGLSGFLHIDAASLALKNISATTPSGDTPMEVQINQNYEKLEGQQWFPSQLESTLSFKALSTNQSLPFPLIATAKSMVSAINLNPDLDPKDFTAITFEDQSGRGQTPLREFRYQPLSAKDSATYQFIDSIGQHHRLDNLMNLQKYLLKGYAPAGPFLVELKRLIGYTNFEGVKLGLGLYTNEQVFKDLSIGGFFTHSLKQHSNNYGGGLKWTLNENQETRLSLSYKKDLSTTGKFTFLEGPKKDISNIFKTLTASTMDRIEVWDADIHARLFKYLRARVFYNTIQRTPVVSYPFFKEGGAIDLPYSLDQGGINLRWNQNENLKKTVFGWMTEETNAPTVWFNFTFGHHDHSTENDNFQKYEGQVEQVISLTPSSKTTFRLTAGTINGNVPNDQLYSYFGTFRPFSIEVPFMFATMAPNEFAADAFSLAFFRHKIPLRSNKPGSFKPNVILTTNAGWGNLSDASKKASIKTFNKGFYESGVYFSNLLSPLFIKYGFAVHYRYGPYQKNKTIDNFSFRLGLEFSL
jgi:hypothetical protein